MDIPPKREISRFHRRKAEFEQNDYGTSFLHFILLGKQTVVRYSPGKCRILNIPCFI